MPVYQNYSTQTVLDAFQWLNKQPDNWMKYIKDKNTMVKMYLKSQKKETRKSAFKNELNQFLTTEHKKKTEDKEENYKQEWGARLVKQQKTLPEPSHSMSSKTLSSSTTNTDDTSSKETLTHNSALPRQKTPVDFLDEKSLQSLKVAQTQLNIQNEEEALRVLIQLGRQSLEKLSSY